MLRRGLLIAAGSNWDTDLDGSVTEPPDEADLARLFGAEILAAV
jgi:hypothetical protein